MNIPKNIDLINTVEQLKALRVIKKDVEIAMNTGFSKPVVSNYLSGRVEASKNFIESFEKFYKVNIFENNLEIKEETYLAKRRNLKNISEKRIPFYDAEASAGIVETELTPIHAPAGTIDVGDLLHDSKAAIRIYGNSMLPNYPPGCVLGLDLAVSKFIEPGEVYVIETRDRRIFKRLFYKDDEADSDFITCYSDNTMLFEGGARHGKLAYPPFNLPKNEIVKVFVVTGLIKRNANSVIINRNL